MRLIYQLRNSLRQAATFNPDIQVAPACVLWPDQDRQWESVMAQLQVEMLELLILGDYSPQHRKGPSIWLRCVLAGLIPEIPRPSSNPFIIYLPGVSRQELRAIEDCPAHLKPLAELQYRGLIWSQVNSKDWTVMAYLVSEQGGLKLDVAKDTESKQALLRSLHRLLEEEVHSLRGKRLDRDFFNGLLSSGELSKELLMWLDQGDAFKAERDSQTWNAFVDSCVSQLSFNPETDGPLQGGLRMAQQHGPWEGIWNRYREAPVRYPNIPALLRRCVPPSKTSDPGAKGFGWPQWNDLQESALEKALIEVSEIPSHSARDRVLELESEHAERRDSVWAELGEARLALSLKHLSKVAQITAKSLKARSVDELATLYRSDAWRADEAVLRALERVETSQEVNAVKSAIQAMYVPWLQDAARELQHLVSESEYPMQAKWTPNAKDHTGECILFVDGLRFDMAKRLVNKLTLGGFEVTEEPKWSALPSVTSTAKPAVTPVASLICGKEGDSDFEPSVCETGQDLNHYHLKKLLNDSGWTVVEQPPFKSVRGGMGWHEFGDIDREGHSKGWRLAKHIDSLVNEVSGRIQELLDAGWKRVRVVTDHGWLLMPDGLPKVELSSYLTENKWGRCAVLKPGASTDERTYAWYWNPHVEIVLPDGIGCFKRGVEYAHGGLSLQECYTLQLLVEPKTSPKPRQNVVISDVVWRGLRCHVVVDAVLDDVVLDIRLQAPNAATSVARFKSFQSSDSVSVIVEDDSLEGKDAFVVLLDAAGHVITELKTKIGGDR